MNTLPSYQAQFNKITEAYIKGEIKPWDSAFCFCGTLAGGSSWNNKGKCNGYLFEDYGRMEKALFDQFPGVEWYSNSLQTRSMDTLEIMALPNYEDILFNGMVAALEVLKKIHIERGEVIDGAPVFQKRELQSQLS